MVQGGELERARDTRCEDLWSEASTDLVSPIKVPRVVSIQWICPENLYLYSITISYVISIYFSIKWIVFYTILLYLGLGSLFKSMLVHQLFICVLHFKIVFFDKAFLRK